jgi:hypothetical protein
MEQLTLSAKGKVRWPTNICFWAAISRNLTPIESAICEQRGGKVFGQPAAAVESVHQNGCFVAFPQMGLLKQQGLPRWGPFRFST